MSWIRTAVSLIGFGFAIVQFFERLQQMADVRVASYPRAPAISGAGSDRQRRFGARHLDLAISVERPIYVGRAVHANRRHENGCDEGEDANAGYRYCHPSHRHRLVCILRRAVASGIAVVVSERRRNSL